MLQHYTPFIKPFQQTLQLVHMVQSYETSSERENVGDSTNCPHGKIYFAKSFGMHWPFCPTIRLKRRGGGGVYK